MILANKLGNADEKQFIVHFSFLSSLHDSYDYFHSISIKFCSPMSWNKMSFKNRFSLRFCLGLNDLFKAMFASVILQKLSGQ